MKPKKLCKNCKTEISGRNLIKKFCCDDCRKEFAKKNYKKKSKEYFKEKCSFPDCIQKSSGYVAKKPYCKEHYKVIKFQEASLWRKLK